MGKWLRVLLGALRWEHYLVRRLHNRATMSLHPCMSRRSRLATGPMANLFGMIIGACGYALKFRYATSPSSVAGRLHEAGPAQDQCLNSIQTRFDAWTVACVALSVPRNTLLNNLASRCGVFGFWVADLSKKAYCRNLP